MWLLLGLLPLIAAVLGDCPPPPKLKNAVFRDGDPGTSVPEDKRIAYECLPNFYNIHNKIDVTQCLRTKWTPIEDFCEQTCLGPEKFRFAKPRNEDLKAFYVPGNNITYECRTAYERIPEINSVIICLQNHTWTELPIFCRGKSCGHPGNPENGKTIIQNDLQYLSKVNFTCNDGYRLIGSPSAQCRLKGNGVKWSQELPNCQQITCVSPPNISHGTYNGSNGTFAYHSTITYKCDDGFSLTGDASLYCITENQIDGIWNGSAPECGSSRTPQGECSSPERIANAKLRDDVLQDSYPVGTNVTYSCISGYQLISGKIPIITCSDNSQWLPKTPQFCEARRCREPNIENGRVISSTDMRLGDEITYACDIGYRLIGENTARCILTSNIVDWNYIPTCQLIPCFPPPTTDHSSLSGDVRQEYAFGSVVMYRCDKGYSLIGNKTLVCRVAADGENGEWDSPPPECKVVQCPRPEIDHGRISAFKPLFAYEDSLIITCEDGYRLSGGNFIRCGADNEWQPPVPKCDLVPEPTVPEPTVVEPEPTVIAPTTVPSGDGTVPGSTKSPKDKPASTKAPKDQPATTKSPKDESGSSSNLGTVLGCVLGLLLLGTGIVAGTLYYRANHKKGKMDTSTSPPDAYSLVPQKTDTELQVNKEP